MNALLMNREGFQVPADGFYQIAPLGEFGHAQAGLTQVVDAEACQAMANRFAEDAKMPNFAGLLVDFDHFSLDGEKRSEAAGWITALECRVTGASGQASGANGGVSTTKVTKNTKAGEGGGLFAKIRWSDVGECAVKGGRYRFLSPVWARGDCADLGNGRVRPLRLLNAAVTNDPNLKGMLPLSNRSQESEFRSQNGEVSIAKGAMDAKGNLANVGGGEPRFKWVLGNTDRGHCPSCSAVAGQVHTMAEWDAAGVKPGADGLFCQGNCACQLVPTDDAGGGSLADLPLRNRAGAVEALANTGWSDSARAASLAVRQGRAKGRPIRTRAQGPGGKIKPASSRSEGGKAGGKAPDADAGQLAHGKSAGEKKHQGTPDSAPAGGRASRAAARQAASLEAASADVEATYEKVGLSGMSPTEVNTMSARIGRKVRNGTELSPTEKSFLAAVGAKKQVTNRGPGLDVRVSIVRKVRAGFALSPGEEGFLSAKG